MQIVCATPEAAAEVLSILYAAHLQLRQDFTISLFFQSHRHLSSRAQ